VQSMAVTRDRVTRYRKTMCEAGFDDERIARNLEQCWVWRNVFVGNTDAEAESIGLPAFQAMVKSRAVMRDRIYRDTGLRIEVPQSDLPSARASAEHGFIHGSPETVTEAIEEIAELGIGGLIATFRLGPLSHEAATDSLTLFMRQVAPEFRSRSESR
jgi:alkanesulfonate monooxygenase SsuD/methylene tetrahydromethanopterin reductase-like flavin-dependent oxidoreductase (luciferase family)